jgi:hypothetical protein
MNVVNHPKGQLNYAHRSLRTYLKNGFQAT